MYLLYALALDFDTYNHVEHFVAVVESVEKAQAIITPITPLLKFEIVKKIWGLKVDNVYRAFGLADTEYHILEWWLYPYTLNELMVDIEDWRKKDYAK